MQFLSFSSENKRGFIEVYSDLDGLFSAVSTKGVTINQNSSPVTSHRQQ